MTSGELIRSQQKALKISRSKLIEKLSCDEKTMANYLNGRTVGGQYLARLLEILEISPKEWNECTNVKEKNEK